jgi:hypothetical protein
MFSQEVVTRVIRVNGETAVQAKTEGHPWETAERYYRTGRYRCFAATVDSLAVADSLPSDPSSGTPAPDAPDAVGASEQGKKTMLLVSAGPQVENIGSVADLNPTAKWPGTDPATEAPGVDAGPETIATGSPPETVPSQAGAPTDPLGDQAASTAAVVAEGDSLQETDELVSGAETVAPTGESTIDALPLPLNPPVKPPTTEFGVFADDRDPEATQSAASQQRRAGERPYDSRDAYEVPAGQAMRYVDPMDLVRQRAVERAENRRRRIEARKWMGYDPLRPAVTAVPYTSAPETRPALVVIPFVIRTDR